MAQADSYELGIDWDRDGFICKGVSQTDPLNVIPNAVNLDSLPHAFGVDSPFSIHAEETAYGKYVFSANETVSGTKFIYFGVSSIDPNIPGTAIPVSADTTYRLTAWYKRNSGTRTGAMNILSGDWNDTLLASASITLTNGAWVQGTRTFTTLSDTEYVILKVGVNTGGGVIDIDITGIMLTEGTDTPPVYNAGDATNYLDDVSTYLEAANWNWGIEQYTEWLAPPSRAELVMNNVDGTWSPENTASVYQPYISKGLLVRLRALVGSTYYQQYIGNLDSIRVDAGVNGARRTILSVVDPTIQMQTTEYKPLLLEDVTTDEALLSMFNNGIVSYPYGTSHWLLSVPGASELGDTTILFNQTFTNFEVGDTTLAFSGDIANLDAKNTAVTYVREVVYAEAGGRLFWNAQTGTLDFHRRTHDIRSDDSPQAITEYELDEPPEYAWGDDVVNDVTITYYPRVIGSAGATLYTLGNLPMAIAAGDTRQWSARYTDPDAVNTKIAGKDMITPVANTDYTINSQSDGGGSDKTGNCTVYVQFLATEATVTIVNGDASTVYVTLFRLRGTPLSMYAAASTSANDPTSIGQNGRQKRVLSLPALGDEATATTFANYTVQRFKTAVGRIKSLSLWANRSTTALTNVLALGVGSYISVSDAFVMNQSQNYIVTGLRHRLAPRGSHWLRLFLEPLDRSQYWILGDETLSVLGETTRMSII